MIPQEYLDTIPTGRWANSIGIAGMNDLILIEKEKIIGTASFCKSRWEKYSNYGEIVSIYFLPDYIGKGCGRLLLNKCMEELRQCGFSKVFLWVLEDYHWARKFYEKTDLSIREYLWMITLAAKT